MKTKNIKGTIIGVAITIILAVVSSYISALIPYHLISAGVFAMLIGMVIHPYTKDINAQEGFNLISKKVLKAAIVLMGGTLSLAQVFTVGKYSLIVMTFTLAAAFGFGNLFGKMFKMNWKLSNLISAGTGICGASAIAAIAPTIEAEDSDIAYAISATFIFDIVMVIIFPLMGRYFGMSDIGYGLWAGTAVNDTSSVVAAGYAFSDAAGNYATIVKITRTLSIIPIVLLFSYINQKLKLKSSTQNTKTATVRISKIFPWFILAFLVMVVIKSSGAITDNLSGQLSQLSKFLMIMALGAIGLKTDFKNIAKSGFKPMLHGLIISTIVVVVSFLLQMLLGHI